MSLLAYYMLLLDDDGGVGGLPLLNLLQWNDGTNDTLVAENKVVAYPDLKLLPKKSAAVAFNPTGADGDELICCLGGDPTFGMGRDDFCWEFYGEIGTTFNYLFGYVSSGAVRIQAAGKNLGYTVPGVANYYSTLPIPDDTPVYLRVERNGTVVDFQVNDDIQQITGIGANAIDGFQHGLFGRNSGSGFTQGKLFWCKMTTASAASNFHYVASEISGATCYDVTPSGGQHGTITSVSGLVGQRAERQDVYHRNLNYGFSLYQLAANPDLLVPYDNDGNPLTITPPAGYTLTSEHLPWNTSIGSGKKVLGNNSENTWINTDDASLYQSTLWFSGGVPVERTWAEVIAYISLEDGYTVVDFTEYLNTCYLTTNGVYSELQTPPTYQQIASRFPNSCGAGIMVPYMVLDGLGGDTPYLLENGYVYLIEDTP